MCGAIVRGSVGIWQRRALERRPMLTLIQPAGPPRALEVSLGRALNGFTKLITSFSAFLKEPEATQVQTSRGSPLRPTAERGEVGKEGLDHTEPRPACQPWERGGGVISRSFQRGSRKRPAHGEALGESPARCLRGELAWQAGRSTPPPAPDGPSLGKEPKAQHLTLASSWAAANSPLQHQRPPKHFSSPVTGVVRFHPPSSVLNFHGSRLKQEGRIDRERTASACVPPSPPALP